MDLSLLGQAVGMFAVTNIDDLLVLAVFFGQAAGAWRIVIGQYLGFIAILVAAAVGALGAGLLPEAVIPYLGLLPLLLGIRAAWRVEGTPRQRRGPRARAKRHRTRHPAGRRGHRANGGDNIGIYVPVFTVAGRGGMTVYVMVFLVGVAVWCAAGWFLATRSLVAKALSRWGHLILPSCSWASACSSSLRANRVLAACSVGAV